MSEVTISVCMITYNHAEYIREALQGVLIQKTKFKLEIIVADDASTDNTSGVIQEIIDSHINGSLIQYTCHSQNIGMMANFKWALQQCKGKYIALCEGDDYWTDPLKLQKQVDFMETNEDFSICYHRVKEIFANGSIAPEQLNVDPNPKIYTSYDLAGENLIHTPSVVFKNTSLIKKLPEWFLQSPVGDYVLHMLHARVGKIYYMPEMMAVYRRHSSGIWSTQDKSKMFAKWVKVLNLLIQEFISDGRVAERLFQQKLGILDYLFKYNKEEFDLIDLEHNMFMTRAYFELDACYNKLQTEPDEIATRIKAVSLFKALFIKCKRVLVK